MSKACGGTSFVCYSDLLYTWALHAVAIPHTFKHYEELLALIHKARPSGLYQSLVFCSWQCSTCNHWNALLKYILLVLM